MSALERAIVVIESKGQTAAFVADKLASFGLEVHTGLAKTGVVGVLRGSDRAMNSRKISNPTADIIERNISQRAISSDGVAAVSDSDGILNCGAGPAFGPTANAATVVARILDQLGVSHALGPRWGAIGPRPPFIERA